MHIIGNGVDIIKNSRINNSLKIKGFLNRIFTEKEIQQGKKLKNKINFYAKRFAAKEAFVKAIGTGFRSEINFIDIEIKNLAEMIADVTSYNGKIFWDTEKPDGTFQKLLDVKKLRKLGWNSKISLQEGLKKTYKDFKNDNIIPWNSFDIIEIKFIDLFDTNIELNSNNKFIRFMNK